MTGIPWSERRVNASMPKLVFALTVLLLALCMPAPSFAKSTNVEGSELGNLGRHLSTSGSPQKNSIAVDMIHPHHFKSPFAQPSLNLSERMEMSVKSSRARVEFLAGKISRERGLLESEKVFTSPVSSGYNYQNSEEYFMEISLGTPPRKLLVIADTGSVVTWVQCADCVNTSCYQQPDPLFDPRASSTYNTISCADPVCAKDDDLTNAGFISSCSTRNTCLYEIVYGDMSSTLGNLANETLTLNGTDGFPKTFSGYTFGCGTNQSDPTFNGSDGLVGLGLGNLSLIHQLGSEIESSFSYCLVKYSSALNKTSPLLLGSVGNLSLTYTPILSNPRRPLFYYLDIIGITVNGVPLDLPNGTFAINSSSGEGGMIIDSGTAFTSLIPAVYNPFIKRVESLIKYPSVVSADFDLCYNISNVTNPVFPDVVLQFTDLNLALPASNLFSAYDLDTVCLIFSSPAGTSTLSVLGNFQQQDFQIGYDLTNNQIGFAPTTC